MAPVTACTAPRASRLRQPPPYFSAARSKTRPADKNLSPETAQLNEAIVCQFDALAAKTALVTSAVNALLCPDITFSGGDISRHLPSTQSRLLPLVTVLSQDSGDPTLLETVSALLDDMQQCQANVAHFLDDERVIGWPRAVVLHQHQLARCWQALAFQIAQCLESTKITLRWNLTRENWQNASVLTSLLRSASNGFTPCINDAGTLVMPVLPQQRRWPRFSVLQNCTVTLLNQTFQALLRDASAGGLGLDQMPVTPRTGSEITIATETGRSLSGTIVWSNGTRTGVAFASPLPENDPLLLG